MSGTIPKMETDSLNERVALITGASRGLGKAMALALAQAGVRLALVARDRNALAEAVSETRQLGAEAESFCADVTDEQEVGQLQSDVLARFGRVDILINNAGVNIRKPLPEFTLAEWNQVISTNLTGVFLLCRAFVPQMKGHGYGRIINMTSMMSHVGIPGRTAYSASKAGLLDLRARWLWSWRVKRSRSSDQPWALRHRDERGLDGRSGEERLLPG